MIYINGVAQVGVGDMTKAVYDANDNSRIEKDALGITLNKLLKGAGAGSDPTEIDVPGGYTEGARVKKSESQAIPDATMTVVTFNVEVYDTDNIHDIATNNERLTCKTAGKYLIVANLVFAANITGIRAVYLQVNEATIAVSSLNAVIVSNAYLLVTTICDLAVNDHARIRAYQNSGNSLNTATYTHFAMQRIG